MEKTYFNTPTQVVFADPEDVNNWIGGIAYKGEIICGCCGQVFPIYEVIEEAEYNGYERAIYPYDSWANINEDLIGGEFPDGFDIKLDVEDDLK